MLLADNYLDRIDFLRYLPQTDCAECGTETCQEFVEDLKRGRKKPTDCPHLSENLYYPFHVALDADNLLPKFPCLTVPRPGPTGLVEINAPGEDTPILISGNNIHTQDVITSILGTTKSPFFLIFADTKGDTVDMAVIYRRLTAQVISKEVFKSGILSRVRHEEIIIPGLASAMRDEIKESTGWKVAVGPICAAELPLFLADRWVLQRIREKNGNILL
jgi:CO dehydrogenase/acetyl-CoA synthase gamma subunit (corrinoid Fe-S protein)